MSKVAAFSVRSTLITLGISYYSVYPINFFIFFNFKMINQVLKVLCMSNTTIIVGSLLFR